ncbi:MAG TPA: hypothetical protein VLF39_00720 [Candidatus Saccharimonadales bacterium]|nr:hypothetical protein [Candidatus Saccharimonadales bacterium]
MGDRQNIIEIKGKTYNATTGQPMTEPTSHSRPKPSSHPPKTVDGFFKRAGQKVTAGSVHNSTQRARTLMRSVVKKPSLAPKSKTIHESAEVLLHDNFDNQRLTRAKNISKNTLVSRFGSSISDFSLKPKHVNLPVKPMPSEKRVSDSPKKPDLVKQSLDKATAHETPKLKKTKRRHKLATKLRISSRRLNIGLGVLAAVLLISFIAQQNIYSIEMRVAAARAGVAANLPGYLPSGFVLDGRIAYRPGEITLNYKSNSDKRAFDVKQTVSNWDSQTLLENYVTVNQRPYQTYQDNGKTIYIYGGSNATWVDQGIWFRIEGNSSLNSDQLLHLANSI